MSDELDQLVPMQDGSEPDGDEEGTAPALDINAITVLMLRKFMRSLDTADRKVPGAAAYSYVTRLKTIYCAAQDEYNDEDNGRFSIPRNPFAKLKIRQVPMVARISKSPDFIRKIRNLRLS